MGVFCLHGTGCIPCGRVCCAAKSLRSLRIYVVLRDRKAVQVYASMLVLFDVWVLCAFWICSAPLSRLTPIEALPQAPLGALPPDPHNGFLPLTLTRGVPLDLLLASLGVSSAWYWLLALYGAVIPHSSFLTPHLNSVPHSKNFPLIIPPKSAILLISKIARNHNPKEVNFYELYSFQKLLSVL